MRPAPKPLSVYLGAAMSLLGADADEGTRARHCEDVKRMIEGIHKYQAHEWARPSGDAEVVWRLGTTRILRYRAEGSAGNSVLVIPSMINGSEILDLLPDRSYAQWMAAKGYDVYLLDWGRAVDDPGLKAMDDVTLRISEAASIVAEDAGYAPSAVGYCMGGTLLLGAAARSPQLFGDLVLLSSPWDFHAGDTRMLAQVMVGAASALQLLENSAGLPVDWIQNVFARVNPRLAVDKFSNFLEMADGSFEQKIFIAVEDWLNGGHDLPAGVARTCILDWYGHNRPVKGEWIDIGALEMHRVLVVAAGKDILVPPESAIAAAQQLAGATVIQPDCGHISLMAGRRAPETVWQPVLNWLNALA